MIFHHALKLFDDPSSGSQKRPKMMLEAFREEGYDVRAVVGDSSVRAKAIRGIEEEIAAGSRFDFVYHESTNIPIYLADPDHIPRHPWLDFAFFKRVRRQGTPVAAFYRDVHWLFREKRVSLAHSAATYPTFWLEWWNYRRCVDRLFLPSLEMAGHLPTKWTGPVGELPPGADLIAAHDAERSSGKLRLLYVGGVSRPFYDVSMMLDACRLAPFVEMTICCREAEWKAAGAGYGPLPVNVQVVHRQGPSLSELYQRADLFFFGLAPRAYLDFAMPVKLFESIGYGLPILAFGGTCGGRFIDRERLGWVESTVDAVVARLRQLEGNLAEVARVQRTVQAAQERNSWRARARTVAASMAGVRA